MFAQKAIKRKDNHDEKDMGYYVKFTKIPDLY